MNLRAAFVLCLAVAACKGKSSSEAVVVGSVRLPAPIASSLPSDPKIVSAAVNPKGEAPYAGPTGTIGGIITVSGDAAPDMPEITAKIPADCDAAKDTYGKLFREGPGRGLADVVVGVTGYAGYLPEDAPAEIADATGCAWNSRTYVLTFGQSLDVRSRDSRPVRARSDGRAAQGAARCHAAWRRDSLVSRAARALSARRQYAHLHAC